MSNIMHRPVTSGLDGQ